MEARTYSSQWNKIPVAVKQFLFRAVIILVVWKVLYLFILFPTRLLDGPLTLSVGKAAVGLLNLTSSSAAFTTTTKIAPVSTENGILNLPVQSIFANNKIVVSIEDGCNGLELFVLYAGFIICLPALLKDKVKYIIGGIILIYAVNVIRCAVIAYLFYHNISHADFVHHYVFTVVVYGFIMWLWYLFADKVIINKPVHNSAVAVNA